MAEPGSAVGSGERMPPWVPREARAGLGVYRGVNKPPAWARLPASARIPFQQWRCEGRKFLGQVQEAQARQVREQVTSRNGTVPSGRACWCWAQGWGQALSPSRCHIGRLEPLPAPAGPSSSPTPPLELLEETAVEFSPCASELRPGPLTLSGRLVPVVFAHSSLPALVLWPCWRPAAQIQLRILSTGCSSKSCPLPVSKGGPSACMVAAGLL